MLMLESTVRDGQLIIKLSSEAADTTRRIIDYRILQGNGEPLPRWLGRVGDDTLIGEAPLDVESIKLRIKILFSDGTFETKTIEVRTDTGEMQHVKQDASFNVVPFTSQFVERFAMTDEQAEELAKILLAG